MPRLDRLKLCPKCKATLLPRLPRSINPRDVHRGENAITEKQPEPDPRAETIRRRKARKLEQSQLRRIARYDSIQAAAKFFLSLKAKPLPPADMPSEECPRCLKLQANQRVA